MSNQASLSPGPARLVTPGFVLLVAAGLAFFTAGSVVLAVASRFADGPLGADATGVGISIGAFAIGALVLRPVVGWGSDRFGRRPMLLLGACLSLGGLALHLVVDSVPLYILARAGLGVAEAFFMVAMLAAASDLAPIGRRGETLNLATLALYLGLAFGPPIGDAVLDLAGFTWVWLTAGALTVLAAVLAFFVPESAPGVLAAAARGERPPRSRLFHPAGIFPGVLTLLGTWGMAGFFAFLPLHAKELGMGGAGLPLAIYAVLVVILRVVFAKLPDQIGAGRLAGFAMAMGTAGLLVFGLVPTPIGVLAGSVVFASGMAFLMPALLTLAVSRVNEEDRGALVGTASVFLDLSFGLAPAVLGFVVEAAGYRGAFLASAAVAGFGLLLLTIRRESMTRPATPEPARLDA